MITIYAEKFDVATKIAASLGGFDYKGKHLTMDNLSREMKQIGKDLKKEGYISTSFKGQDCAVTWGQGHMCTLMQAKDYDPEYKNWSKIPLPIIPDEYRIKVREGVDYKAGKKTGEADPWTIKQLNIIDNLFSSSEYIINATDCDREGELIFAYVYEYLDCKVPYKRVRISSQTEEGLRAAFDDLTSSSESKPIEMAGRARSIADWVVGANLTTKMTLKYNRYLPELKLITVGRVQTVILDFIVTREKAIRDFVSEDFYYIDANFTDNDKVNYLGKHTKRQIMDKSEAEALLNKVNGKKGLVSKKEDKPFKKQVPLLYNLTNLQKEANQKYGFTASQTLEIAQSLYNDGFLTYPRSEFSHLNEDMRGTVDNVLDMLSGYNNDYKELIDMVEPGNRNYTKRHFDDSKVDAHFAIIPTNKRPEGLDANQSKIYDMVARSLIRIIFKAASGYKTEIETSVEDEIFKTNGNTITDPQWMLVSGAPKDDLLPDIALGESYFGDYQLKKGKTTPPNRYTDSTLLLAMETASKEVDDEKLKKVLEETNQGGIGRPSTQASLIESVVRRYCYRKGKYIYPSEDGMKVIEVLPVEDLKSPELTAKWEADLDLIAKDQKSIDDFIAEIEDTVVHWCQIVNDAEVNLKPVEGDDFLTSIACPACGSPMRKLKWGWACSAYDKNDPDSCRFSVGYNMSGAKLSDSEIERLITKGRTSKPYTFKKKDSSETYTCYLEIKDGKLNRTWRVGLACPKCGGNILMSDKSWYCENWKNKCDFTIWDTVAGKKLTIKNKEDLIRKGETGPINGFKKKAGGTFSTSLILDDNKKVVFKPFDKK